MNSDKKGENMNSTENVMETHHQHEGHLLNGGLSILNKAGFRPDDRSELVSNVNHFDSCQTQTCIVNPSNPTEPYCDKKGSLDAVQSLASQDLLYRSEKDLTLKENTGKEVISSSNQDRILNGSEKVAQAEGKIGNELLVASERTHDFREDKTEEKKLVKDSDDTNRRIESEHNMEELRVNTPIVSNYNDQNLSLYTETNDTNYHQKNLENSYDDNWTASSFNYKRFIPPGLPNLGNTCYANAILQCLVNSGPLTKEIEACSKNGILCSHFSKILFQMHSMKDSKKFRKLLNEFRRILGEKYRGCEQQDAFAFLTTFLRMVANETRATPLVPQNMLKEEIEKPWRDFLNSFDAHHAQSVFSTIFIRREQCKNYRCTFQRFEFEASYAHILSPQKNRSLTECMESLFDSKDIPRECPKCKQMQSLTSSKKIWKMPKMFVLQLNKAKNGVGANSEMNKIEIMTPNELNLNQFWANESPFQPERYSLYAFVKHFGYSFTSGHYTSVCWNDICSSWVSFNDMSVHLLDEREAQREISSKDVLILFYKSEY